MPSECIHVSLSPYIVTKSCQLLIHAVIVVQQVSSAINNVPDNHVLSDTNSLCCVTCRSRKRERLQTLQVWLGELEKENARLKKKLSQKDAEMDKFRQGLPSHHPGK